MTRVARPDSWIALTVDLLSARLLVWLARAGKQADLTQPAHLYFSDRYRRLAEWHERRGRRQKAARLRARAEHHRQAGGGEDGPPPYAAALAMPRPRRFVVTEAVSRQRLGRVVPPPDDAA
jgi:hypothetical protein